MRMASRNDVLVTSSKVGGDIAENSLDFKGGGSFFLLLLYFI